MLLAIQFCFLPSRSHSAVVLISDSTCPFLVFCSSSVVPFFLFFSFFIFLFFKIHLFVRSLSSILIKMPEETAEILFLFFHKLLLHLVNSNGNNFSPHSSAKVRKKLAMPGDPACPGQELFISLTHPCGALLRSLQHGCEHPLPLPLRLWRRRSSSPAASPSVSADTRFVEHTFTSAECWREGKLQTSHHL